MNRLKEDMINMMRGREFGIEIRNAGVFRFPAAYRFEMHNHREIEIDYISNGSCVMEIGGVLVPLKRGDCIIVYAGEAHQYIVEERENCRITQLEFTVKNFGNAAESLSFFRMDIPFHRLNGCEEVNEYMEHLCRIYRAEKASPQKELLLELGFLQLFIELSDRIDHGGRKRNPKGKAGRIAEIIRYINENWEYDINIEELAEQFGVSSRYVRKCFQQETGISCQKYICTLRIGKAKELLWYTSKSVTDIAMKTGFGSSQYFCRVFQQYTNMTPLEYRNLWKGRQAEELYRAELE